MRPQADPDNPQNPGEGTHRHGKSDHLAYRERPFQEALAVIHPRMHELGMER